MRSTSSNSNKNLRKRPAWLRALGNAEPPSSVQVEGNTYQLQSIFKHDSWAATALYADASGARITCKFNRMQPVFVIPMQWLGRTLARREAHFLRLLRDVPLVPDDLGPVVAKGLVLQNALARRYVDGAPFRDDTIVDARFFEQLRSLLDAVHRHDMAYVDMHKRENIIIDLQGQPHLIDFQVSYSPGRRWPWNGRFAHYVLRQLQQMDDYNYRKHYARCLKHLLSAAEYRRLLQPTGLVRWHRKVGVPLRTLRRRLLTSLHLRDRSGQASSELEPEDAFRKPGAEKDRPYNRG